MPQLAARNKRIEGKERILAESPESNPSLLPNNAEDKTLKSSSNNPRFIIPTLRLVFTDNARTSNLEQNTL